ncbi:uncharacterized protein ASCRUDRAFT_73525 [Ascoidea rubescens DSM 1968]|uniref:Uncharacterized protein n=1 Tax=Ascoidea rubescens DSM 1968 TaxID=1344418 RepID=A0A1D2VQA5_9ASCO|nr:hypothetical protein ASCRUDRAFT_73525 [Ascoidea rubescens DSM 1968]ODV63727.1 hypothetical protein ASCRUDRAFT_73525 [Ascoidea rubescens DSM 1968]
MKIKILKEIIEDIEVKKQYVDIDDRLKLINLMFERSGNKKSEVGLINSNKKDQKMQEKDFQAEEEFDFDKFLAELAKILKEEPEEKKDEIKTEAVNEKKELNVENEPEIDKKDEPSEIEPFKYVSRKEFSEKNLEKKFF